MQRGTLISNQGAVTYDADGNGTNEANGVTDDPAVGGAADPTSFAVRGAQVSGTKTVSGVFSARSIVTYTVVLSNTGNAPAADNAGNEFTDVLPAALTLVSASATSGTVLATVGTNTVTWNGSVPANGSVTITIAATVMASASGTISNQGTVVFDADLDGTNETTVLTDDPRVPGAAISPTVFSVRPPPIPALGVLGIGAVGLALLGLAGMALRRRGAAAGSGSRMRRPATDGSCESRARGFSGIRCPPSQT